MSEDGKAESSSSSSSSQNIPSSWNSKSKSIPDMSGQQQKVRYPHPPDLSNPDPATLRDQWRYAIKQYSKWYSHAWGTAILAGLSFFALGWVIKGSNPLPSFSSHSDSDSDKHHHPNPNPNPNPK